MKVLKPINDIMHGHLKNPLGMKETATKVNKVIIEFYDLVEVFDIQ